MIASKYLQENLQPFQKKTSIHKDNTVQNLTSAIIKNKYYLRLAKPNETQYLFK